MAELALRPGQPGTGQGAGLFAVALVWIAAPIHAYVSVVGFNQCGSMSTVKRLGALFAVLLTTFSLVTPTASAATDLLPDLRMKKPDGFYIQVASNGERRLRFNTVVGNYGAGPFHVLAKRPDTSTARMSLTQRVALSDGRARSVVIEPSKSYAYWGGDGHSHWHIDRLQEFTIRKVDDRDPGLLGPVLGRGAKIGFCFYDNTKINLSLPNAPQAPRYTGCGASTATQVTMGLSVGWGDIYTAQTNYQWIKINGLKDGKYRIHVRADHRNNFQESSETNNTAFTTIRITGNTVSVVG